MDLVAAAGRSTSDGRDAEDEVGLESEEGMEWEDGEAGRSLSSDDNTSLSWVKTGDSDRGGTLGNLEVTVNSDEDGDEMEFLDPSEPIDDD